jgi:hypothetical protein
MERVALYARTSLGTERGQTPENQLLALRSSGSSTRVFRFVRSRDSPVLHGPRSPDASGWLKSPDRGSPSNPQIRWTPRADPARLKTSRFRAAEMRPDVVDRGARDAKILAPDSPPPRGARSVARGRPIGCMACRTQAGAARCDPLGRSLLARRPVRIPPKICPTAPTTLDRQPFSIVRPMHVDARST